MLVSKLRKKRRRKWKKIQWTSNKSRRA